MVERTVRIGSTHVLHARPAEHFTKATAASGSSATLQKTGGAPVPAVSILAVIAQGIDHGDEVTIVVDGDDEQAVLNQLGADHDE